MSDAIKFGPFWSRIVVKPESQAIKRRGLTLCYFDEVKQLRMREIFSAYEEEQLLNRHPDVEKSVREVELWLDLKDGRTTRLGVMEQGGLLLSVAAQIGRAIGVPVLAERVNLAEATRGDTEAA